MNNMPKFGIDAYVMISGGYVGRVKKIEIDGEGVKYYVTFYEGNYKPFSERELTQVTVSVVAYVPQDLQDLINAN